MSNNFRIRLARKFIPLSLEITANFFIILNNAVMHQRNMTTRDVRMSIAYLRRPMGSPSCMCDTGRTSYAVLTCTLRKLLNARHSSSPLQDSMVKSCDPARVIATILKAAKALQKHRHNITTARGGNNSTHIFLFYIKSFNLRK